MDKKLIALYPILFEARQYNIGDELPANNTLMVEKWLSANTAEWRMVEPKTEFNKEYYEKLIAELKENHKNEIQELVEKYTAKIKSFEENQQKDLDDINEVEETNESEESQDVNNVQEESTSKSKNKKGSIKTTK